MVSPWTNTNGYDLGIYFFPIEFATDVVTPSSPSTRNSISEDRAAAVKKSEKTSSTCDPFFRPVDFLFLLYFFFLLPLTSAREKHEWCVTSLTFWVTKKQNKLPNNIIYKKKKSGGKEKNKSKRKKEDGKEGLAHRKGKPPTKTNNL
jgi:hypothetical protein